LLDCLFVFYKISYGAVFLV